MSLSKAMFGATEILNKQTENHMTLIASQLQDFVNEYQITEDFNFNIHPATIDALTKLLLEKDGEWLFETAIIANEASIKELLIHFYADTDITRYEGFGGVIADKLSNTAIDALDDIMSDLGVNYSDVGPSDDKYAEDSHERFLDVSETARGMRR